MKIFQYVTFAVFLGIVIFLANLLGNVETLEERLQYTESQIEEVSKSDAKTEEVSKLDVVNEEISSPVVQFSDTLSADKNIQYTYVPSYSHVYRNNGRPLLLESTLSIRNTDPQQSLIIHKVGYYDSKGKLLRSYVNATLSVDKLASVEYLSEKMSEEGGFGAFFVVLWSSDNALADPVIESVMIESTTHKQVSFVSRGKTLPFTFDMGEL